MFKSYTAQSMFTTELDAIDGCYWFLDGLTGFIAALAGGCFASGLFLCPHETRTEFTRMPPSRRLFAWRWDKFTAEADAAASCMWRLPLR